MTLAQGHNYKQIKEKIQLHSFEGLKFSGKSTKTIEI